MHQTCIRPFIKQPGYIVARAEGCLYKTVTEATLFPLNQNCVAVAALGGSEHALVSTLSVVTLAILPADVKATSQIPFPHP